MSISWNLDSTKPSNEILVKQEKTRKPARDALGRLLPGNTANPNGRPKRKTITEMIHEKLDTDINFGWPQLIEVIISMASSHDKDIIKEIWHYTEGMPKQTNEIIAENPLFELHVESHKHTNGVSPLPTKTNGSDKPAV